MVDETPMLDAKGRRICGAKTRAGAPCHRFPIKGAKRCKKHGGTQPVGVASPNYKHGRYSQAMPKRLNDTYERVRADKDFLNLSEQFYLLETRLQDTMKRADLGEAGALWLELGKQWRAFKTARTSGDVPGMQLAIDTIDQLVSRGTGEAAAWQEMFGIIERQRKVVETEQKRRVAMQAMVTTERMNLILDRLVGVIDTHVHEPKARQAMAAAIRQLVAGEA